MADNPISQFTFKELHLFPRSLFALGVFLIGFGTIKSDPMSSGVGLALYFGAIGVNILYYLRRAKPDEATRIHIEKRWMRGFCGVALILCFLAIWMCDYVIRHPR